MRNLYVWGWWQGHNLGDNWIKKTISNIFPKAIFVETTVKQFENNSFIICGGGGLFIYDVVEPWSCLPPDTNYGILGLGAEFPHPSFLAQQLEKNAKFFLVRDQYSLDCMHLPNIERSYDITFSHPLKFEKKCNIDMNKVFFVWREPNELLLDNRFVNYLGKLSSCNEWKEKINNHFNEIVEDDFYTTECDIEDRIGNSGFIISGRYHGIVAAIQKGLPFVAIDICPKIRALLQECNLEEYCLKIGELDKLEETIIKAKEHVDEIRKKEQLFRTIANKTLSKQISNAKVKICKVLHPNNIPLKVLLFIKKFF